MIFVDTVAFLALWDVRDQWHAAAEAAFVRAYHENWTLLTTTAVIVECGNAIARKPYRQALLDLRAELINAGQLIDLTTQDWEHAWSAYETHAAGDAGIVDLVSFEVMRRMGIEKALTNDGHYKSAGFETLF